MINNKPETEQMLLREASTGDITIMAEHHKMMFEEIWAQKGEPLNKKIAREIQKAYAQKLAREIICGICKAWVIEDQEEIIASGAITFVSFVPNPYDLSSKIAYLHSIYTRMSHRNKKCAQRIIYSAIKYCNSQGVKRIILSASNAGKPIYEKIGFRSTPEMMRLLIEEKP